MITLKSNARLNILQSSMVHKTTTTTRSGGTTLKNIVSCGEVVAIGLAVVVGSLLYFGFGDVWDALQAPRRVGRFERGECPFRFGSTMP